MTPEQLQQMLASLDRVQAEAVDAQNLDEKVLAQIRVAQQQLKDAYAQAAKGPPPVKQPPAPVDVAPPAAPEVPAGVAAAAKVALQGPPPLDGNDLWGKILTELKLVPKAARVRKKPAGADRELWQDLDDKT